jgi:serine/threonine protein kinase
MTDSESLPNRPDSALRAQLEHVLSTNYELDQEIGRGGMGIVYRARDKRLKRLVAVKLLPPELAYRSDIRSRFLREAETAAQLSHPNIVPIYTVEETDNLVFFIMGYVNGENLARRLSVTGPMPPDDARRVLREVADALAYAHARNVIHRDVKPDNILLDADTQRAMVTDFGIARAVTDVPDTRLTTTGAAIGTPAYMSPEQCSSERGIDGRSDLYSLGVVGYQLLSGELPFSAPSTLALFMKHVTEEPIPLADRCNTPPDLNAIIMQCLAKQPAGRFANASELVDALDGKFSVQPAHLAIASSPREPASPHPISAANLAEAHGFLPIAPAVSSTFTAAPLPVDVRRWDAEPVRNYRKRIVSFMAANAVLIPLGIVEDRVFFAVSTIWAITLAARYPKLLSRGYDWRDVFRRSRDTLFVDVVGETFDSTRAIFDPERRPLVRERIRARLQQQPGLLAPTIPPVPTTAEHSALITTDAAAPSPSLQEAASARADIHRLIAALPASDRDMIPDVAPSADALYARIEILAATADDLGRADHPGMREAIDHEITHLEAEANPLDEAGSDRRVRRLSQLRRQRISLRDLQARRELTSNKFDRCMTAMRSMRLDLLRLSTGRAGETRSYESVTHLAHQALQLGQDVDTALYAHDEIARVLARRP